MIQFVVNGTPFTDFTSAFCNLSVSSIANDFSFTATAVNGFPPFKKGDEISVIVDNVTKLTGFIETIAGSESEGSHVVTYSGRDKTGDVIDSKISGLNDIRASGDLTLKKIIELVLANINSPLTVTDVFNPPVFNEAEDLVDAKDGTDAAQLMLDYAKKRQALISSDGNGNFVITQSSPTDSGEELRRTNDGNNNIISQSWTLDDTQEYNLYILRGQLDPRTLNFAGETDIASVVNQGARVTNSNSRVGRQIVIVTSDEKDQFGLPMGYSNAQLLDRAKWSAQLAKAKGTRFNCTVREHQKESGGLWEENTLVQINSIVADITRKMLIDTVTFSQAEGQATVTKLQFVEKDVYTINEKILAQRPVGDQNDVFKSLG